MANRSKTFIRANGQSSNAAPTGPTPEPEMQRRHFEIIARTLREWRVDSRNVFGSTELGHDEALVDAVTSALIERMSDVLAETNPRFDRDRFLRACYLP